MTLHSLSGLRSIVSQNRKTPSRSLFYWLVVIFNSECKTCLFLRVDAGRIREVGADYACAEWLLRNGAFVRWKGFSKFITDYNILKEESNVIAAVEANNAGINYIGFPYFEGCKHIEEIKFKNCKYIENKALSRLLILKSTLTHLEIVDCKGVDDNGLLYLKELKKLETLKISGLPFIKDKNSTLKDLAESLPNCKIEFQ